MENLVEFRHIRLCDSQNREILKDLSFEVRPGEVHAIICTKGFVLDRVLDMFCGQKPYAVSGTVCRRGTCMNAAKYFLNNKNMAYILQENTLYSAFSAIDNIYFNEKFSFHYDRERKHKECQEVLDAVGLKLNLDCIAVDLSPEERKILEFLRFFLSGKELAVVYESVMRFSADYLFKLNRLIDLYKRKGKSIVFLTSSVDDAMRIADRVSVLERERITKTYKVEEIYNSPQQFFDLLTAAAALRFVK